MFSSSIASKSILASHNNNYINNIDLATPGYLPQINQLGILFLLKAGILLNCKIKNKFKFERKNYFYFDLPKGFQLTEQINPVVYDGKIIISNNKQINIRQIQLEEDTAKQLTKNNKLHLNYNRSGIALLEIVTEPNFTSYDEIEEFIIVLGKMLNSINISNCNMSKGNFRVDVNISVSTKKYKHERTEIKNLNSLKNIKLALNQEIQNQLKLNVLNKLVTKKFDEKNKKVVIMRKKNSIYDYTFFCWTKSTRNFNFKNFN